MGQLILLRALSCRKVPMGVEHALVSCSSLTDEEIDTQPLLCLCVLQLCVFVHARRMHPSVWNERHVQCTSPSFPV